MLSRFTTLFAFMFILFSKIGFGQTSGDTIKIETKNKSVLIINKQSIDNWDFEVEVEQNKQHIIEQRQGLDESTGEDIEKSIEQSVEEKQNTSVSFSGYAFAVIVIVACFMEEYKIYVRGIIKLSSS